MPKTIFVGYARRHTGLIPRRSRPGQSQFPTLPAAGIDILPRTEWLPLDLSRHDPSPMDQDGRNACASFAAVQACQLARDAAGLPYRPLSPGSLYARVNGGRDQGSTLEDNLAELIARGVNTANAVPTLTWRYKDLPNDWPDEALLYKVTEAWDCPTFEALATALTRGWPTCLAINVGSRFAPDDSGWIAYQKGTSGHGLAGEALCVRGRRGTPWQNMRSCYPGYQDALRAAISENAVEWGIRTPNSWAGWGAVDQHGRRYGIIPEAYFTNSTFNDGWAIRVVTQTQSPAPKQETAHA